MHDLLNRFYRVSKYFFMNCFVKSIIIAVMHNSIIVYCRKITGQRNTKNYCNHGQRSSKKLRTVLSAGMIINAHLVIRHMPSVF